jgi:glutathione peroxidase
MKSAIVFFAVAVLAAGIATANGQDAQPTEPEPSALAFKVHDIDGNEVDLAKFQGDVVLIVNVASQCGLTPQYNGLQSLYEKYTDQGFAVLGFPCNQFGGQEPGTEAEIKAFCQSKFDVSFPMFSKVSVNGGQQCDLYKFLTSLETKPVGAGDISWNFEKFLVNRRGEVVARFGPRTKPDDDALIAAIEKTLAEAPPKSEK